MLSHYHAISHKVSEMAVPLDQAYVLSIILGTGIILIVLSNRKKITHRAKPPIFRLLFNLFEKGEIALRKEEDGSFSLVSKDENHTATKFSGFNSFQLVNAISTIRKGSLIVHDQELIGKYDSKLNFLNDRYDYLDSGEFTIIKQDYWLFTLAIKDADNNIHLFTDCTDNELEEAIQLGEENNYTFIKLGALTQQHRFFCLAIKDENDALTKLVSRDAFQLLDEITTNDFFFYGTDLLDVSDNKQDFLQEQYDYLAFGDFTITEQEERDKGRALFALVIKDANNIIHVFNRYTSNDLEHLALGGINNNYSFILAELDDSDRFSSLIDIEPISNMELTRFNVTQFTLTSRTDGTSLIIYRDTLKKICIIKFPIDSLPLKSLLDDEKIDLEQKLKLLPYLPRKHKSNVDWEFIPSVFNDLKIIMKNWNYVDYNSIVTNNQVRKKYDDTFVKSERTQKLIDEMNQYFEDTFVKTERTQKLIDNIQAWIDESIQYSIDNTEDFDDMYDRTMELDRFPVDI